LAGSLGWGSEFRLLRFNWRGAASRRNEAAGWLRRTVGAVAARDLPEEPSEEEFRLGLRNGQILCGALNRVHPGAVPKASAPCVR
jgi:kinesin family protein C2/C3